MEKFDQKRKRFENTESKFFPELQITALEIQCVPKSSWNVNEVITSVVYIYAAIITIIIENDANY